MNRLRVHGCGVPALREYLKKWNWPKGYGDALKTCKKMHVAGNASQYMNLVPVLDSFLREVVQPLGVCGPEVASALHCFRAVSLLQVVNSGCVSPLQLGKSIIAHLRHHQDAYGDQFWKPKHNFSMHLPLHLHKHKCLFACFCHERKHRLAKQYAEFRTLTRGFEKGIMLDITIQHLHDLRGHKFGGVSLIEPKPVGDSLRQKLVFWFAIGSTSNMQTASQAYINSRLCVVGDVIAYASGAGNVEFAQLHLHLRLGADDLVLLSKWDTIEKHENSAKVRAGNLCFLLPASDVIEPCVHTRASEGEESLLVIPPKVWLLERSEEQR